MSRDYTIGATDADTGVAEDLTAPNAGAVVKVPDYTDVMDGPKAFVEFANSMPEGGGGVTVSDTEPANPDVGDQWFKSDTGKLYVYYGTAWIESSGGGEPGLPYSFGAATPTTTDSGFLWYDSNSTPPVPKYWDGSAWQAFSSGLSGLGGWANITATTGSPTKHEYTDADGNDWTAYEWTGDGTVTTSDGLVDALVISGGSIGATHPQGGRITYGIDKLSGVIPVVVDGPGGSSAGGRLGDIKVPSIGGANQAANVIGAGGYGTTSSDKVNGVLSDITGSPVEYGTALTSGANTPVVNGNLGPAGPGSANREGTVIVRVPRSNAKA